uniref:TIL domain-containing protein n=1 Tax=Panagrolaimus sp. JU765 TaxID=591449 RepID=A0AC34PV44_9BILA
MKIEKCFFILLLCSFCCGQDYNLEVVDSAGGVQKCQTSDDCEILDAKCVVGECVILDSIECPPFMRYSECLNKCAKTCQSLNETENCREPETCIEGCECIEDYYWNQEEAVCISRQDCEALINKEIEEIETMKESCPQFAEPDLCPNPCGPKLCENFTLPCNKKGCGPKRCSCRPGFVQFSKDINDGCIPEYECFPIYSPTPEIIEEGSGEEFGDPVELIKARDSRSDHCPIHTSLKDCVPLQPMNCYTLHEAAPFDCGRQRCECDDGFVRQDSGDEAPCIPIEECQKYNL